MLLWPGCDCRKGPRDVLLPSSNDIVVPQPVGSVGVIIINLLCSPNKIMGYNQDKLDKALVWQMYGHKMA